ncbi:hypothetical protein [Streptomyces sp. AK02-04a]|uniref:hypothetical protein n=1 Tax=Streptomyces sp. AK02-04a TaxID=3028649 RepID=UPI0029A9689D|nr:hypothetical protein [Streptomyces sp. AK02-04a]MDX3762580.1 hypothetical protein [Streptomyces sp. AK02-04a]
MSAPTPAGPAEQGHGLQPSVFGRPSPALIARADRGYARFLATTVPAVPSEGGQGDAARQR